MLFFSGSLHSQQGGELFNYLFLLIRFPEKAEGSFWHLISFLFFSINNTEESAEAIFSSLPQGGTKVFNIHINLYTLFFSSKSQPVIVYRENFGGKV